MLDIETITVREVSHSKRTCFYPAAFSGAFILGETMILNFMRNHSDNYDGGRWKYYSCTNGAFFSAPENETYRLSLPNYFQESVSGKVAGIIAMIYALSNLSGVADDKGFHNLTEYLVHKYNLLWQYVNTLSSEEYGQIKRACD
ncbi:TPA: antirestriction protein [Escherichia coli]